MCLRTCARLNSMCVERSRQRAKEEKEEEKNDTQISHIVDHIEVSCIAESIKFIHSTIAIRIQYRMQYVLCEMLFAK